LPRFAERRSRLRARDGGATLFSIHRIAKLIARFRVPLRQRNYNREIRSRDLTSFRTVLAPPGSAAPGEKKNDTWRAASR
jgi:hypothetical protein